MTVRRDELAAAATIRECQRQLAACGTTILSEAIGGIDPADGSVTPWRRYPEGEVYDPASHAQYFYHAHPPGKLPPRRRGSPRDGGDPGRPRRAEHGHFHLFLRKEGMPHGMTPQLFPEALFGEAPAPQAAPRRRGDSDEIAHLVAISLDESGSPLRFFATNRWVTGETWYCHADVLRMIDRFAVAGDAPSPVLNRWLGALLQLYRDELAELLEARDEEIVEWRWRWERQRRRYGDALDDTRLEIIAYRDIDLEARLAAVEAAAREPITLIPPVGRAALPRLAEGWGD